MKLSALQERVWQEYQAALAPVPVGTCDSLVLAVVQMLGFHVDSAGEICDPRPAPPAHPRQQNVHYRGSRRRRK